MVKDSDDRYNTLWYVNLTSVSGFTRANSPVQAVTHLIANINGRNRQGIKLDYSSIAEQIGISGIEKNVFPIPEGDYFDASTGERLTAYESRAMASFELSQTIAERRGRTTPTTGDGLMAERILNKHLVESARYRVKSRRKVYQ